MKKTSLMLLLFIAFSELWAQPAYVLGKNRYTLSIDGDTREYYVHVPKRYTPGTNLPVVFMLHGTTGNGDRFYKISGWKELGDSLNIITVYPSSWRYCLVDDPYTGDTMVTTRWNDFDLQLCVSATQPKRNDIHFLNSVMDDIIGKFSVDTNRIYMVGFSNGGGMAGRCAIELSNRLAAVVEDAGTMTMDTVFTPLMQIPIMFRLGNIDDRWLRHTPTKVLPMNISLVKNLYPQFRGLIGTHVNSFALDSNFTSNSILGGKIVTETYRSLSGNPNSLFVFSLVKGLDHHYPNTKNHWMYAAAVDWDWMRKYHK